MTDLSAENDTLREALKFYADPNNWILVTISEPTLPTPTTHSIQRLIPDDMGPSGDDSLGGSYAGATARKALYSIDKSS